MRTAVTLLSTTIASIIVAFGHKIVTGGFPPGQREEGQRTMDTGLIR